jgi:hypothetical protein
VNVNPVEAVWLAINLFAAGVIFGNVADAFSDWRHNRGGDVARGVVTRASLRRELIDLYVVLALLVIVVPALFREGDIALTPLLALFISAAAGIALNSYLDRRTRRVLRRLLWADDDAKEGAA